MHKKFESSAIEKKWQQEWAANGVYRTNDTSDKPKTFVLDMFPYPSGEGLHVGHPKGYIATDIYSRFKRMNGHEVLHPMGWDAFGLPAENFAIKHKVHPRVAVDKNVSRFKEQLSVLGFDYDWDREINTTDPEFYKWTQWIFIQLYKKGLAYQSHEPINWCPGCQTGLANEDLESDGTCERCDSVVEKRPMRQWVLKIREYADRMLADLDTLAWPEHIKEAQRNWIGRSKGAEIDFRLSTGESVTVFTTRPDTLFGATYMVLAPEHELVAKNQSHITNWSEVADYIEQTAAKKEMDRLDDTKEKTGVKLEGITATNPANGEKIPVFIADYVLASYGTGAIMAVPAHDERDNEFAKRHKIQVRPVVLEIKNDRSAGGEVRKSVYALLKNLKGEYLIQHYKKPNYFWLPGGGVDEGETEQEALLREIKEETGYTDVRVGTKLHEHMYDYSDSDRYDGRCHTVVYEVELTSEVRRKPELEQGEIDDEIIESWITKDTFDTTVSGSDQMRIDILKPLIFDEIPVFTTYGILSNSGEFDGLNSEEAKQAIVEKVGGRMTSTYKIKDWVFSRQRYWGEPFPMIHGEDGEVYTVAEEQLPVVLPEVEHYEPSGDGESPLSTIDEWVNVTGYLNDVGDFVVADEAPEGKELLQGKRETNTMPQWAGSSWYYLRYIDPHNNDALVDSAKEKDWQPVDVYVGGDHAVRHLIYARFWHKFLYDIGVVSTLEPFQRLEFLGFILAEDGRKMSKRWGNVINPDDIVAQVGADTMRVYEMFMGPFENTIAWSQDGLVGARRFLEHVNGLSEHASETGDEKVSQQLHKTIDKVSKDIESFKFNTAVSAMMVFVKAAEKSSLTQSEYESFLKLLAPFAPHLAEELWHEAGRTSSIHVENFPEVDEALLVVDEVTIGVQVNGKHRGSISIAPDATEQIATEAAKEVPSVNKWLEDEPKKVIYVPGKILNFIV